MKKTASLFLLFCLTSNLFGQSKIIHLAGLLKGLDKTWKLRIDTSRKTQHPLIAGGQWAGFLAFTKGKQEITYCVYQSLNNNIESAIQQTQKLASCTSIGLTEKNRIAKQNDLVIFLSIYPCWAEYSEDSKKLIQKIFTKLKR